MSYTFAVVLDGNYASPIFSFQTPTIPPVGTLLVRFEGMVPRYFQVTEVRLKVEPFTPESILRQVDNLEFSPVPESSMGWLAVDLIPFEHQEPPTL